MSTDDSDQHATPACLSRRDQSVGSNPCWEVDKLHPGGWAVLGEQAGQTGQQQHMTGWGHDVGAMMLVPRSETLVWSWHGLQWRLQQCLVGLGQAFK